MGTNGFLVFDELNANIMSTADYANHAQRKNGVQSGDVADPGLHNRLYRQATMMAAAIGQYLANKGATIEDGDFATLVNAITGVLANAGSITSGTLGVDRLPGPAQMGALPTDGSGKMTGPVVFDGNIGGRWTGATGIAYEIRPDGAGSFAIMADGVQMLLLNNNKTISMRALGWYAEARNEIGNANNRNLLQLLSPASTDFYNSLRLGNVVDGVQTTYKVAHGGNLRLDSVNVSIPALAAGASTSVANVPFPVAFPVTPRILVTPQYATQYNFAANAITPTDFRLLAQNMTTSTINAQTINVRILASLVQ